MFISKHYRYIKKISFRNNYSKNLSNIKWTTNNVRSTFINYFVDKHKHEYIQSASVKPIQLYYLQMQV